MKKIIRIIAIAYAILLSSILAVENVPLEEQYRMRLREGQRAIEELQEKINTALRVKKDTFALARKEIYEKRSRLQSLLFLEELDSLLKLLHRPEELFSEKQRQGLIALPTKENLQPIELVIGRLGQFIEKCQLVATKAERLQLAANQTLGYQGEWKGFSEQIASRLAQNELTKENLLEVYRWVSYFHSQVLDLLVLSRDLRAELDTAIGFVKESFTFLSRFALSLIKFFEEREVILWKLIRKTVNLPDLPENHAEIPKDFFQAESNPIKDYLEFLPNESKIALFVEKAPSSPQKKSSPILRLQSLIVTSRPSSRDTDKRIPDINDMLLQVFSSPNQWKEDIRRFQEEAFVLIPGNFIIKPLIELLEHYRSFKNYYIDNLSIACDILTSKALLNRHNHSPGIISHTIAKTISRLKTNGPLCFNMPDTANMSHTALQKVGDEGTNEASGWAISINNLTFRRVPCNFPNARGAESTMSLLECLFGIYSEPIVPMVIENIRFFEEKILSEKEKSESLATATMHHDVAVNFINNPAAWVKKSRYSIVTVQRNFEGTPLCIFLERVALGLDSFDRLNCTLLGWSFFSAW